MSIPSILSIGEEYASRHANREYEREENTPVICTKPVAHEDSCVYPKCHRDYREADENGVDNNESIPACDRVVIIRSRPRCNDFRRKVVHFQTVMAHGE